MEILVESSSFLYGDVEARAALEKSR